MNSSNKGFVALVVGVAMMIIAAFSVWFFPPAPDYQPVFEDQSQVQSDILGIETQQVSAEQVLISVVNNEYFLDYLIEVNGQEKLIDVLDRLSNQYSDFTIEYQDFDFGKMVIAINGYTPAENEFWNIKLNGSDAQIGVSDLEVNPNDNIQFIITTF